MGSTSTSCQDWLFVFRAGPAVCGAVCRGSKRFLGGQIPGIWWCGSWHRICSIFPRPAQGLQNEPVWYLINIRSGVPRFCIYVHLGDCFFFHVFTGTTNFSQFGFLCISIYEYPLILWTTQQFKTGSLTNRSVWIQVYMYIYIYIPPKCSCFITPKKRFFFTDPWIEFSGPPVTNCYGHPQTSSYMPGLRY